MTNYIETLSIKKIFAGYYEVVGHHRGHEINIVSVVDGGETTWHTEGCSYSSLKDAKANVFQELATEYAEIY